MQREERTKEEKRILYKQILNTDSVLTTMYTEHTHIQGVKSQ